MIIPSTDRYVAITDTGHALKNAFEKNTRVNLSMSKPNLGALLLTNSLNLSKPIRYLDLITMLL